ncbi:MAG: hypothetical protein IPN40_12585 [Uliginosibacterium sp.]|nr:hypothetical protein [Uliginosibacterium sp.]
MDTKAQGVAGAGGDALSQRELGDQSATRLGDEGGLGGECARALKSSTGNGEGSTRGGGIPDVALDEPGVRDVDEADAVGGAAVLEAQGIDAIAPAGRNRGSEAAGGGGVRAQAGPAADGRGLGGRIAGVFVAELGEFDLGAAGDEIATGDQEGFVFVDRLGDPEGVGGDTDVATGAGGAAGA